MDGQTHADIEPFKAKLDIRVLQDMTGPPGWVDVKVFAVASFEGHTPTFQVLVEDSYLFDYVPIHMLASKEVSHRLELGSLVYANAPKGRITVNHHAYLAGRTCDVYNRAGLRELWGTYMFTVDWIDDNFNLHMVRRSDGHFCLWPSHKITFGKGMGLPDWKKLRQEWKV